MINVFYQTLKTILIKELKSRGIIYYDYRLKYITRIYLTLLEKSF